MSLGTDVRLLWETVAGLQPEYESLEVGLVCHALFEEVARELEVFRRILVARLAEEMPQKLVIVAGTGSFVRHRKVDRRKWDSDMLVRAVLDTRLVNTDTGEVKDETQLEKVLAVWNLGAPRVTVLRARGLDPEEFCETERGGWQIQVIRP